MERRQKVIWMVGSSSGQGQWKCENWSEKSVNLWPWNFGVISILSCHHNLPCFTFIICLSHTQSFSTLVAYSSIDNSFICSRLLQELFALSPTQFSFLSRENAVCLRRELKLTVWVVQSPGLHVEMYSLWGRSLKCMKNVQAVTASTTFLVYFLWWISKRCLKSVLVAALWILILILTDEYSSHPLPKKLLFD